MCYQFLNERVGLTLEYFRKSVTNFLTWRENYPGVKHQLELMDTQYARICVYFYKILPFYTFQELLVCPQRSKCRRHCIDINAEHHRRMTNNLGTSPTMLELDGVHNTTPYIVIKQKKRFGDYSSSLFFILHCYSLYLIYRTSLLLVTGSATDPQNVFCLCSSSVLPSNTWMKLKLQSFGSFRSYSVN